MNLRAFLLLLSACVLASVQGMDFSAFMDIELPPQITPMFERLDKALPMVLPHVKSSKCKQRGKDLAKKAKTDAKNMKTAGDVAGLMCSIGSDCIPEYLAGLKKLVEAKFIKKILDGLIKKHIGDELDIAEMIDAVPMMFDVICSGFGDDDDDARVEL